MGRDNLQFGPWTTSLHHSSRLELSAFWRRRLGRLASLAIPPVRLSWASIVVLCIVAGMLLVVPRLRLETIARAEDQEEQAVQPNATSAKPQAASEQSFTATFSNGVKVQLVGLSINPSKDQPWWAPNGTPLDEPPYRGVRAFMHPGEGGLARELCWRWLNAPDDRDFETRWMTEPHYNGAGGGRALDAGGKPVEGLTTWAIGIPTSEDTFTVRFSVSIRATPWKTVFTHANQSYSSAGRRIDGVGAGVIFGERFADNRGTAITVSHQIPGKAVRLVAVDMADQVHLTSSSGGSGAMGFYQMTCRFADMQPDQIQRFELQAQTRTFETIEFRNVSLHPEKQTDVEIVRLPDAG